MSNLKDLKKGDIIDVEFGYSLRKAKVLRNYPDKERIYIKIRLHFWGLIFHKTIKSYNDYNFDLLR